MMTSMEWSPSVSVVIPTHNRPGMLREAAASALTACPAAAEVLVVDDRSRESASMVLSELTASDARLRVIHSEGPPGAAGARNTGAAAARSALVLFLDDDDWLLPGYPDRVMAAAEGVGAPVFGFCATLSEAAAPDEVPPPPPRRRLAPTDGVLPPGTPLRRRISGFGTGFWIRRSLYLEIGGCDPAQRVDEDTEFCCRLAVRQLRPWYGATPGVRLRNAPFRADRLTRSTSAAEIVACYRRTWNRHENSFPRWSEERWFLATRLVRRAVREGRVDDARAFIQTVTPPLFRAALLAFLQAKLLSGKGRSTSRPNRAD
jgi:glycosyltransferase involved in cell wall biosynthesis